MSPTSTHRPTTIEPHADNVLLDDVSLVRLGELVDALTRGHSSVALASSDIAWLQHHALALTSALRVQSGVELTIQPHTELDALLEQFNALSAQLPVRDARKPPKLNTETHVWLMHSAEQYAAETLQTLQRLVSDFPGVKLQLAFVHYGDIASSALAQWPNLWCWPIAPLDEQQVTALQERAARAGLSQAFATWASRCGIQAPAIEEPSPEEDEMRMLLKRWRPQRQWLTLGLVALLGITSATWLSMRTPNASVVPSTATAKTLPIAADAPIEPPPVAAQTSETHAKAALVSSAPALASAPVATPQTEVVSTDVAPGVGAPPQKPATQAAPAESSPTVSLAPTRTTSTPTIARTTAPVQAAIPEAKSATPAKPPVAVSPPAPAKPTIARTTAPVQAATPEAKATTLAKPPVAVPPPAPAKATKANAKPATPPSANAAKSQPATLPEATDKQRSRPSLQPASPTPPAAETAQTNNKVAQVPPTPAPTTEPAPVKFAPTPPPTLSALNDGKSSKLSSQIQSISTQAKVLSNFRTPKEIDLTSRDDKLLPSASTTPNQTAIADQGWIRGLPNDRWLIEHVRLETPEAAALWAGSHPGLEHARLVTLKNSGASFQYALVTGPFVDQRAAKRYADELRSKVAPVFLRGEELKRESMARP